jgi:RNA polymerase sigma-70 factor (ECF subfamily)
VHLNAHPAGLYLVRSGTAGVTTRALVFAETVVPAELQVTPDRTLVERMTRGDERAVQTLVDRHGDALYALAYSILQDPADAEEVAADAFLQAWRKAGSFDASRASVTAWLAVITRSRALDRLRSRKQGGRHLAIELDPVASRDPPARAEHAPDRELEASEAKRLVDRALGELPEPQRRVIELAYFSGLSQSEIAERMSIPLGTVKTRTLSAMKRLREALAPLLREGSA